MKAFGQRVRFMRKLEGLTQAQLAECAGISLEHLNKLERGAAAPSFKAICALARALSTEPANLLLFFEPERQGGEASDEARHSDWLKHVSDLGVWHYDPASDKSVMSASLNRLLGRAPRQTEQTGCVLAEFVVSEDKERFRDACEHSRPGAEVGPLPLRVRRADGEARRVILTVAAMPGAEDGSQAVVGCMVDVTEPLHLEDALRRTRDILEVRVHERTRELDRTIARLNEEIAEHEHTARTLRETDSRTRNILDSLPLLIATIDADERYLFVNRHYLHYRGNGLEDCIGRSVIEVMGPQNYARSIPYIRKALAGERAIAELPVMMPDGSAPYLYAQWLPTRDEHGEVSSIFFWAMDISERKFAEEALRKTEERFRLLVENMRELFWIIEADLSISYLSPAFERIFEMPCADAYEKPGRILSRVVPEDRAILERLLRGEWDEPACMRHWLRIENGSGMHRLSVRNYPVSDEGGKFVRLVGIAEDVTDCRLLPDGQDAP
ncbi:transcriptional regulator, XRE family [Desulfovibrio sp. X2]|nr:transcriptional regulator, XRE family [Desulfovibrio sp. X2]